VFSILLNLLITIAQIIGGFISGSLALISDALHNFSDVITLNF
jgi:cobalt-zinc-cadmium efflux system protein